MASEPVNTVDRGLPLVTRLPSGWTPEYVFDRLVAWPRCVFLDSAQRQEGVGRFSFVMADPYAEVAVPRPDRAAWQTLQREAEAWHAEPVEGLPPFQGGLVGVLSYEFGRAWEEVPAAGHDEFGFPALVAAWYDVVLAFDHVGRTGWIISQGFPETDRAARRERAAARMARFMDHIDGTARGAKESAAVVRGESDAPVSAVDLVPQYRWEDDPDWTSNFDRAGYEACVRRVIDYIEAGDVFQVNLAQRLLARQRERSPVLYGRLRRTNPAPFGAYFDGGSFQVLSASPERFLSVCGGQVQTRPIKGTRRHPRRQPADLFSADLLAASEKDRAENTMIVDLLRNDLSRVCRDDSIRVDKLCGVEQFQFVQHLVSVVSGRLDENRTPFDLFAAAFPGGSITGAPKIRAMEIIAELEPTVRGAYCGSLFYVGFDGAVDSSILIRTVTAGRGWLQLPVGGGIVADSDPSAEYVETCHKAAGIVSIAR